MRLTAKPTDTLVAEWIGWFYSVAVEEYYRQSAMCVYFRKSTVSSTLPVIRDPNS